MPGGSGHVRAGPGAPVWRALPWRSLQGLGCGQRALSWGPGHDTAQWREHLPRGPEWLVRLLGRVQYLGLKQTPGGTVNQECQLSSISNKLVQIVSAKRRNKIAIHLEGNGGVLRRVFSHQSLFFPLLEFPKVVLYQESGIELPHGYLII